MFDKDEMNMIKLLDMGVLQPLRASWNTDRHEREKRKMTNVLSLESIISKNEVVQVDSSMKITNTIDWMAAATKVVTKDAYILIPRANGDLLRSPSFSMPKPLVIGLNVYVPDRKIVSMRLNDHVSKSKILIRDDWVCQYCGEYGNTIDHIMPKSRGGLNTWGNLCVACKRCNGLKSNSTPEEIGFKSPVIPSIYTPPSRDNKLQKALYSDLEAMM